MSVAELLKRRRATRYYNSDVKISRDIIDNLLNQARLAPSGFNLQSWRVIVVDTEEGKNRLYPAAMNQQKILDASAICIICGDTDCWQDAQAVVSDQISKGYFAEEKLQARIDMIQAKYEDPDVAHESIFRDATFFAMTLMILAEEIGIATAPLSGFDPIGIRFGFGLPESVIPVMLVTLGERLKPDMPRPARKTLDAFRYFNTWGGTGEDE